MNKFKYYIEMVLNESKSKEQIKIIAVFYDKNKQKKKRFSLLHKQDIKALETRMFQKDTDMTEKINNNLDTLATKLSEIKNNITEENKKIDNFKYKLKEKMENVKTEFQSLYDSVKNVSDSEIKDSLEIEAIVKINDKNTFTITMDRSNILKIEKK